MSSFSHSLWPLPFLILSCAPPEDEGDVATSVEELSVSRVTVAPIHAGNALTLPAQRHLVRIGQTELLALQQDGADGRGLGFLRSDDDGSSWRYLGAIQSDFSHSDTADLLVVGNDVALVYSYEGPTLAGSVAHDVYFQWWRYRAAENDWAPHSRHLVFDSTSSRTGYYRAEIARDSHGRFWVQAFKLEADGTSTARIATSADNGATFTEEPPLAYLPYRGGGRIIALGKSVLFLYDGHEGGLQPARFRVRVDGQPPSDWGPKTVAFNEGIYHGAALSAVADGGGGLHLVYKDKAQRLFYRHFDGATFGARTLIDDVGGWEVQPAITRLGADLAICYNRAVDSGADDEVRYRLLHLNGGLGVLGAAQIIDGTTSFKGYPTALDSLPATAATVPCLFCVAPGDQVPGNAQLYLVSH